MGVDRAGRAVDDVNAAAVGLPTGQASAGEVLIGVGYAAVVLSAI
jgi:hypothetical protein